MPGKWVQVAADTFNRANENPIQPPWILGQGNIGQLLTNTYAKGAAGYGFATYDLAIPINQKISATFLKTPGAATDYRLGARCNNLFTTGVDLTVLNPGAGGGRLSYNFVALGGFFPFPVVAGDLVEVAVVGRYAFAYRNGVLAATRAITGPVTGPPNGKAVIGGADLINEKLYDNFFISEWVNPHVGSWILRLTDNFNRANENPIAAPWVTLLGPAPLRINAQEVQGTGAGVSNISLLTHPLVGSDQRVDLTIHGTVGGFFGIILRFNPGPNSGYYIILDPQFNSWSVNTYVGGVLANITNGAIVGGGVATNCVLRAEMIDEDISVYVNDVLQTSFFDLTFSGLFNTATGIYTAGALPSVDNYKIYSWSEGIKRRNRRHRGGELWGIIPEVANYLG